MRADPIIDPTVDSMVDAQRAIATEAWAEANQRYLVLEFARLRWTMKTARKEEESEDDDGALAEIELSLRRLRETLDSPSAIDRLSTIFGLSRFERQTLLLCAGVEMDSALAAQCSDALGQEYRAGSAAITFSLALATLDKPHWSATAPSAPLRRLHLIRLEAGRGLTSATLRIDERVLHYLAGVNKLDALLEPLLHGHSRPRLVAAEHVAVAEQAGDTVKGDSQNATLIHLRGDDARGQEDVAALAAERAGRQLFVLPVESVSVAATSGLAEPGFGEAASFLALWEREMALLPGLLMVQCGSSGLSAQSGQLIERLPRPVIVGSRDPLRFERATLRFTVDKPRPQSQRQLWMEALAARGASTAEMGGLLDDLVDDLGAQFRLSAESMAAVAGAVRLAGDGVEGMDRLWDHCRSLSRPRLESLATRIVPAAGWDDLILPETQKATLRQLAAQARHRMTVYETWGFAAKERRGLGITALFSGPSGTGKTMAAEVLAKELRLDLYRIDLSAVVSKYIGETEKNLKMVFDAAEEGGVLLLFDEADALFGKRAEVKDSHDRYANIEVSYLLQRMESFQGIAVLTSNLKSSLDKAFQRRLRFAIDFPFPGASEREAIWARVFPAATPTSGLEIKRLAQLNMTGGNIRNIALNAAFLAAEAGTPLQMTHVLQATRQEAIKTERPLTDAETRGWA